MDNMTIQIGRILAPYLLVSGSGLLISKKFYEKQLINSEKSDPLTVNLSGMVHFFIGIVLLNLHFLWNSLLAIIITLLGISFVLKGGSLIIFPDLTLRSGAGSARYLRISGIGFILLGLILGYLSYLP
jgi:hypothetical protein